MLALSNNHNSVDDQVADVVSFLSSSEDYAGIMESGFNKAFPEYNNLTWSGSWVDCESSNVDVEYMSWVVEWIEANTPVIWEDGEPYLNNDVVYGYVVCVDDDERLTVIIERAGEYTTEPVTDANGAWLTYSVDNVDGIVCEDIATISDDGTIDLGFPESYLWEETISAIRATIRTLEGK